MKKEQGPKAGIQPRKRQIMRQSSPKDLLKEIKAKYGAPKSEWIVQDDGLLHKEIGENSIENFIGPVQPYKRETRQNELGEDLSHILIQN